MTHFSEVHSRYGTYSTQWDYVADRFGEKDLLPFSISDMDFKIPAGTAAVLEQAVRRSFFGYTRWNHQDYKQSISNWFANQFSCEIVPDWCVYSPSVIYSLSTCLQLLSQPKDRVVTFTPCYDAFFNCILQNNRELLAFPLNAQSGFSIDFEALEELFATKAPVIFLLCNPHNPTGRVFTQQEMTEVIQLCNHYQVALVSDEIHMDVRRPGQKHLPLLQFDQLLQVPAVLLSSTSKTFNTPGLGGSYAIFPDQQLRDRFLQCLKARDGLSSIPYLALLATMDCYTQQNNWLQELNQTIDENFKVFHEIISQDSRLKFTIPEATYLGWISLEKLPYSMDCLQKVLVKREKVAIMRGDTYGEAGKNYLRFNLGAPQEKIIEGAHLLMKSIAYLDQQAKKNN